MAITHPFLEGSSSSISRGGGNVHVNKDGSVDVVPASNKKTKIDSDLDVTGEITGTVNVGALQLEDGEQLKFGTDTDYWFQYDSTNTRLELVTSDSDGSGTDADLLRVSDGGQVVDFQATPTVTGTNVVLETRSLTGGDGIQSLGDLSSDRTVAVAPGDFTGSGLTTSGSPANIDVGAGTAITVNSNDVQVTSSGITTTELDTSIAPAWTGLHKFNGNLRAEDDDEVQFGTDTDYILRYDSTNTRLELHSADTDGGGTAADIFRIADGTQDIQFLGSVEIDADLNHDGSNVGFFGTAPVAQQTAPQSLSTASGVDGTTTDGTLEAIPDTSANDASQEIERNFEELKEEVNQLRTVVVNLGLAA